MKVAIPIFLIGMLSAQGAVAQSAVPAAPSAGDRIDTVNVEANKIPLEKAIHNFVQSYAQLTDVAGKIARWSAGMPLCPYAIGLQPTFNVFVDERIRTVAGMVVAPLDSKVPCVPNLVVIFTPHPQEVVDDIAKNNEDLLGYHEVSQKKELATMTHPIQAWYETGTRDDKGVLHTDKPQDPRCAVWQAMFDEDLNKPPGPYTRQNAIYGPDFQNMYRYCGGMHVTGNRATDGLRSEIGEVTVVVDANKIIGLPLGAVADYIAMLALSQTKAFETCQPLSSITNLMTPGCEAQRADALTQTDVAYLKALYKMNPDVVGSIQMSEIAHQMEDTLIAPGTGK